MIKLLETLIVSNDEAWKIIIQRKVSPPKHLQFDSNDTPYFSRFGSGGTLGPFAHLEAYYGKVIFERDEQ